MPGPVSTTSSRSSALRLAEKYDEAMSWFNPCLAWAERIKNDAAIGHTSEQMGEIAVAQGENSNGMAYFKSALQHFRAAGYSEHSAPLLTDLEKRIDELK